LTERILPSLSISALIGDPAAVVGTAVSIPAVVGGPLVVVGSAVTISAVVATTVVVLGSVAVPISITATHRVDLYDVAVIVDMDMIANAAPAGDEAVRQARPLDLDIVVSMSVQSLLGLTH
jgi:hypothetical protein